MNLLQGNLSRGRTQKKVFVAILETATNYLEGSIAINQHLDLAIGRMSPDQFVWLSICQGFFVAEQTQQD